jgi:hypothetical protein
MSSVDYTPVILAQLTDLQMRVTKQEATIAALKAEVERLTGSSVNVNHTTMRTSIPLRQHNGGDEYRNYPSKPYNNQRGDEYKQRSSGDYKPQRGDYKSHSDEYRNNTETRPPRPALSVATGSVAANTSVPVAAGGGGRSRPRVAPTIAQQEKTPHPTMALSDVLEKDEVVTIQVGTGKDAEGNFTNTTATAVFDGTDLNVTECSLVASLVGMKSSKPGEILYKFIDELKNSGHIKKTFSIAPWRLCFVERNGVKKTLEELRTTVG